MAWEQRPFQKLEQALLRTGLAGRWAHLGDFRFETLRAESLPTPPGAWIADDFVNAVVESDGTGVGFYDQAPAHIAVRHTVAIAVELYTEIFVHQHLDMIAMIVRNDRQWFQRGGLKTIQGPLPGFAMLPWVGDFREPLADLAIDILQIGELAQRPEALTGIADGALHFALLPAGCRIAGPRVEAVFPSKGERARKKTDQLAIVLGHRSSQVVVNDLTRDTTQSDEGMHVTADESLKALAVRELQKQHTAVSIDRSEGVELALVEVVLVDWTKKRQSLDRAAGC